MGEDPSNVGAVAAGQDGEPRTSEEIRRDIEQTREELGDTAAALGAKTDVKGRARERLEELKREAAGKKDEFAQKAGDAAPSSATGAAAQARASARANPTPTAAVGALLIGFALGRLSARR
jgi:ElaB/YqjD/DUF883 family membrane-anchored ribosome-binding protein